ncbi:MAG TPA: SPOR domain-containing protein [Ferrovibrio sp.]|uniref:SPOR domain-containing protein n=1 Tax=Ferrovibrio sp. TaxID=1917215 RepID=UPI002B4B6F40|nr:SPOR domain-containing protein [Ferrovibrio sp.]HLT77717.1 SPOR domain-containing protein [Ferrovibrio sp.]
MISTPANRIDRLPRCIAVLLPVLVAGCAGTPPAEPAPAPVMPAVLAPQHPVTQVVPPAPVPLPPKPVLAGHVASFRTRAEAEAALPRLLERFPVLGEFPRRLVEIDLGPQRGKVVRLLVGAFADTGEASRFCHKLRGNGVFCAPHDLTPESLASSGS